MQLVCKRRQSMLTGCQVPQHADGLSGTTVLRTMSSHAHTGQLGKLEKAPVPWALRKWHIR